MLVIAAVVVVAGVVWLVRRARGTPPPVPRA